MSAIGQRTRHGPPTGVARGVLLVGLISFASLRTPARATTEGERPAGESSKNAGAPESSGASSETPKGADAPRDPRAKGTGEDRSPAAPSGASAGASGSGDTAPTSSAGLASATPTPKLQVTVEPETTRIGDTIRLTASIESQDPWKASATDALKAGEKLGPFRILDVDLTRPAAIVVGLTPDEPGSLEIPSFEVVFRLPGKDDLHFSVPAAKIQVASTLGEGDATLSDLKPPAEIAVPWPWREIGLGLAGAVIAAAVVVGFRRWLRKPARPALRPEDELPEGVTADAWARDALQALLAKNLIESGRHREFHIELADLARRYLELRFRIPALERTTEEVGQEMRTALCSDEALQLATAVLERCDRVKFAKHVPALGEPDETVALTSLLIERTAPAAPLPSIAESERTEGTAA